MEGSERREEILRRLSQAQAPVSAASLARQLGVSRQAVVGDVALLRAQGSDVVATARGYTLSSLVPAGRYIGKIACQHSLEDTEKELTAIVRLGGHVADVSVAHFLYGEMTGQLNLSTAQDVEAFVQKVNRNKARLLSELTDGVHVHTVSCRDADTFDRIRAELGRLGLLYGENK
ncbi:MAG: transcription repressor NadR [Peptococcaceae bacterium]|jgi:transcriptional regulator of NAD metabolism|nr:transcription repressor NadR [Peptococcaceae bacterium]